MFNFMNGLDSESENENEKEENFYELLNIEKGANQDQIKKAFRKAALANHPDRGGDEEEFKKYQKAYSETL